MPDRLWTQKQLHNAVVLGDLRKADRCIDQGASVNGMPELKHLPL